LPFKRNLQRYSAALLEAGALGINLVDRSEERRAAVQEDEEGELAAGPSDNSAVGTVGEDLAAKKKKERKRKEKKKKENSSSSSMFSLGVFGGKGANQEDSPVGRYTLSSVDP
jgi:predicted ribosome quality control (RQC) complex YloA/Tae2 family protein